MNNQHIVIEMESFNGANERTISVTTIHAWFSNDVSHFGPASLGKARFDSDQCWSKNAEAILNKI
jgi:hypothetical protein